MAVQNRKDANGFPQGYIYEMNRQGTLFRAPFAPSQYTTQLGGSCTIPVIMAPQGLLAAQVAPMEPKSPWTRWPTTTASIAAASS